MGQLQRGMGSGARTGPRKLLVAVGCCTFCVIICQTLPRGMVSTVWSIAQDTLGRDSGVSGYMWCNLVK